MTTTNSLQGAVQALRKMGLSQVEIAAVAKVSQMTISRWDRAEPQRKDLEALGRMNKKLEKMKHGGK